MSYYIFDGLLVGSSSIFNGQMFIDHHVRSALLVDFSLVVANSVKTSWPVSGSTSRLLSGITSTTQLGFSGLQFPLFLPIQSVTSTPCCSIDEDNTSCSMFTFIRKSQYPCLRTSLAKTHPHMLQISKQTRSNCLGREHHHLVGDGVRPVISLPSRTSILIHAAFLVYRSRMSYRLASRDTHVVLRPCGTGRG